MAITRQQKEAFVAEYSEKLARSKAAYFADYRGLTVAAISDLRGRLREQGDTELAVAKNTLLGLALREAGLPVPEDQLAGPTAVLFCYGDPVSPTKVLTKYAKDNDKFVVKGGIVGNRIVTVKDVQGMSELPSREQILATVIGAVQGPAQNLFGTITAPLREIVQVLQARAESQNA
ncbi:MAG: 50S ribosomal protein L10 [Ardenticatenales bacterium]|nr:50S ribosomal protein L10 [Ardenticatenales bacterium]